jgi:hypothetical protein
MLFGPYTHLLNSFKFYTIYIEWVEFESDKYILKRAANTWGISIAEGIVSCY